MRIQHLNNIRALVLDMDGVVWRENEPIGNLPKTFDRFEKAGLKVILATNNSTKTPGQYVEKLAEMGVSVRPDQVVNSSMGVAYLLKKRFPKGGSVYIVGEKGLQTALEEEGFRISDDHPLAVVAGIDREVSFPKLKKACLLIRSGIPFYGTNPDRTFPTPEGLIPGAGAILAALVACTDVSPIIAGKPGSTLFEFAMQRLGTTPSETLVVGDRIETDILGGVNAGCKTALVLSGVTTKEQAAVASPAPDLIIPALENLLD